MEIKRLQQMLAIARTGSISRAAEELHITQPALSRSIATLEMEFGIRIFDRGRSGAVLTSVGKLAVAEAEELVRRAQALEHNLRHYGRGEAGNIAFGMGPLIASLVLSRLGCRFLNERPGLQLRASVKSANVLMEELMADKIELLFCASGQVEPCSEIKIESVGGVDLAMVVRAGHPLAGKEEVNMAEVTEFPLLSGAEHSANNLGQSSGAFICDNYQILAETVQETDGVWMSSPQLVAADLETGRLKKLDVRGSVRPDRVDVAVVSRESIIASPAALAIVAFVRDFFVNLDSGASI